MKAWHFSENAYPYLPPADQYDSIRVSLISPLLGVPALAVPVGCNGRLRPGVQILAPRFREDLCLDAGEVIEAAEGVVMPIDPVQ